MENNYQERITELSHFHHNLSFILSQAQKGEQNNVSYLCAIYLTQYIAL